MKKFSLLVIVAMLFAFTYNSLSIGPFYYADIALDEEGNVLASYYDDGWYDINMDVRLTLLQDDSELFQQVFDDEWIDEFGYFNVFFGYYWDQAETTWVDISDYGIMPDATTYIKVELRYGRSDWYTVSLRQLSEALRYHYGMASQYTSIEQKDAGKNGKGYSDKWTIRKQEYTDKQKEEMLSKGIIPPTEHISVLPNINLAEGRLRTIESKEAIFDARKSSVFINTGEGGNLNVNNPRIGQIVLISNEGKSGNLNFGGMNIEPGDTYQFLYTGKSWSRIK